MIDQCPHCGVSLIELKIQQYCPSCGALGAVFEGSVCATCKELTEQWCKVCDAYTLCNQERVCVKCTSSGRA